MRWSIAIPVILGVIAISSCSRSEESPAPGSASPVPAICPVVIEEFQGPSVLPSVDNPLIAGEPRSAILCGYGVAGGEPGTVTRTAELDASETALLVAELNGLPIVQPPFVNPCEPITDQREVVVVFSGAEDTPVRLGVPGGCRMITNGIVSQLLVGPAQEPGERLFENLMRHLQQSP